MLARIQLLRSPCVLFMQQHGGVVEAPETILAFDDQTRSRTVCALDGMQDDKLAALRDDIDNLEQEAQRHEARIATHEQKVADLGQQIADLPPPPQVQCLQLVMVRTTPQRLHARSRQQVVSFAWFSGTFQGPRALCTARHGSQHGCHWRASHDRSSVLAAQRQQAKENELRQEVVELQGRERTSMSEVESKNQDIDSTQRELGRLKGATS